jgi:hypothetical protein
MATPKTADEKADALFRQVRTHFRKAAKKYPDVAQQFNQIVDAIDLRDEKTGSVANRKSKRYLESLSVLLYVNYMASAAKSEDREIRAEFAAVKPELTAIRELLGLKASELKAAKMPARGRTAANA